MKTLGSYFLATALAGLAIALTGCGGNGGGTTTSPNRTFLDLPATAGELATLKAGDKAFAMVEREDGIKFVPITLGNTYVSGSDLFYTFKSPERDFGFGDSGSPIVLPNGKTIGALSGSFGGDNVLITPIDKMLSAVGRGQANASDQSFQTKLAWFGVGMSDRAVNKFKESNIHFIDAGPTSQAHAATRGGQDFELTAGKSMAAVAFDGPLVQMFAIGTLTHNLNENEAIGFGHPLNWDGSPFNGMPVSPARVVAFVKDPLWGSFKLAVPTGEFEGGIAQDRSKSVLINRSLVTQWVSLTVITNSRATTHRICRFDDLRDQELFLAEGLGSVVPRLFDQSNLGLRETVVKMYFHGGKTLTLEPAPYDWSRNASYDIWAAIADQWSNVHKVEITIN